MADIQQGLSDLETLWGINPAGKSTVDIPVKLVADIVDLLKEQENYYDEFIREEIASIDDGI